MLHLVDFVNFVAFDFCVFMGLFYSGLGCSVEELRHRAGFNMALCHVVSALPLDWYLEVTLLCLCRMFSFNISMSASLPVTLGIGACGAFEMVVPSMSFACSFPW